MHLLLIAGLSLATAATSAAELSLAEALARARSSDPIYLSAQANRTVALERSAQAVAAMRPQLSASISTNANRRNYTVRQSPLPPTDDAYNSNSAQLSWNQPIWRHANAIAVRQADAVVEQVDFQGAAAEQDLLVRLSQAWFDLMLARDAALAAQVQLAAARYQSQQYRHAVRLGLAAESSAQEASAKFEQAQAEHAGAQAEQEVKLAMLEQITGPLKGLKPPALAASYVAVDVRERTLEQWVAEAEDGSPAVWSARYALEAAQEEIRKQRAAHEPTLDVVASYGNNGQVAGGFPGQNGYHIKQGVVGVQLNIPLFAGGGVNAKVREAIGLREKAEHDLESAKRQSRLAAKQAWFYWHAGQARQQAGLQGMKAAAMGAEAAATGQLKGVKAGLDVLQAEQQRYAAWRDLQKARYDMITSHLKLRAAVGRLDDSDLVRLDAAFERDAVDDVEQLLARFPVQLAQGTQP